MHFKKILISAGIISLSASMCATTLISCGNSGVDKKYKINLNSEGKLYEPGKLEVSNNDYKTAIKNALTRSDNWIDFKSALASEIVYQWFSDRMKTSSHTKRNENFKVNYDEWKYDINKEYKDAIQTCKDKYGANYKFYLQNEYLSPKGGTVESYKHAQLVDKVKNFFIQQVFNNSYFSLANTGTETIDGYENIFLPASKSLTREEVNNPENWKNIGFYARSYSGFAPEEIPNKNEYNKVNVDWLANHPDGDYAIIQQYTFDRWFETEKPFFSSAALFKYSNPRVGTLLDIYNADFAGITIDTETDPLEIFPFFGATDGKNSTQKFYKFLEDIDAHHFNTQYYSTDDAGKKQQQLSNGTITIPADDTDDSQTILLCFGEQMIGGATNSLYTPYAIAAGNIYSSMMNYDTKYSDDKLNLSTAESVRNNMQKYYKNRTLDNPAILANFWFTDEAGWNPLNAANINSYLDLNECYGKLDGYDLYHCPIFQSSPRNFKWWYGPEGQSGVRYITNAIQVNNFPSTSSQFESQPWVMEINESGMHIQTIDGYEYVTKNNQTTNEKLAALKKVVMYRLLQKQSEDAPAELISANMYGDEGFLPDYFKQNFDDIVLEIAMKNDNDNSNIFRIIDSYDEAPNNNRNVSDLFLNKIYSTKDQKMGNNYANICAYLKTIIAYDRYKKDYDALVTANNKIYAYRKEQISNSKEKIDDNITIGKNGLLAPIAFPYEQNNDFTHDYAGVNRLIMSDAYFNGTLVTENFGKYVADFLENVVNCDFVNDVKETQKDAALAFSPQIKIAKSKKSNRFWYKSPLIDKFMYTYMGNNQNTSNQIKDSSYNWYSQYLGTNILPNENNFINKYILEGGSASFNAYNTIYQKSKLINDDNNFASYASSPSDIDTASKFYKLINDTYLNKYLAMKKNECGEVCNEVLDEDLFKATIMYLISSTGSNEKLFDKFYEILNGKIADDEIAFVGYLTRGYANINSNPITNISNDDDQDNNPTKIYNYNPNVDNIFDQTHMAGGKPDIEDITPAKYSFENYWNVMQKKWTVNGIDVNKDLAGFLGIQTKTNNNLSGCSSLQTTLFNSFGRATSDSYDLSKSSKYSKEDYGCFYRFAGVNDYNGNPYKFTVKYNDETITNEDFKDDNGNYLPSLKLAYKIASFKSFDDLRTLAKSIDDAYPGFSYFSEIISDTYYDINEMKHDMLVLLPCKKSHEHACNIECFYRLKNTEVHTIENTPKYAFSDISNNTGYRLMLTQINKSDIIEKTLTPTFDINRKQWVMDANSPLTEQEFWTILMNLALDSTVQQLCVAATVDAVFGSKKLIVYDAQLYNQFNSTWISNWVKKPIDL